MTGVATNRLDGKVAIVTGAGTTPPGVGIGCAIARVLAGAGASVLVVDKVAERGEVTRGMIADAGSSHPAYAASKGGVFGITVDLAGAYGRDNIRVNAVLPGMIVSPIQASIGSASPEMQQRMNMLGRMGNVWDIAHAVGFLCTDEASYITGLVMPVDGGATAAMPSSASRPDRPGER